MKRRKFLKTVGWGICLLLVNQASHSRETDEADKTEHLASINSIVKDMFADTHSAKAVGFKYLDLHPEKCDQETLLCDAGLEAEVRNRNLAVIRKSISHHHEQDFTSSNTVIIDNWVLTRTEASLCALLATT